jgi:hypothetical protein
MEMFNKKELDKRIGPLKKVKSLYSLEEVEGYFRRKCSEYGIECSYDVMAEEMPYFKTLAYTEYAGNFYIQPLNFKLRNEQMIDAEADNKAKTVDYASMLIQKVVNNDSNKYSNREQNESLPPKDYLVVLPGSNKVRDNVCLNKLKDIKQKHKSNVYFKPHPITTHQIIGELKDFFGEECILPRNINMYYYLQKAKGVYTTHISESCVYSVVLGKKTEPIDVWNNIQRGSFYCINSYLLANQHKGKEYINKTFSSPKSGIINPMVDLDWKKKIDQFFEYIMPKRELYKNWFIADQPK